jgi:hypothetical protein
VATDIHLDHIHPFEVNNFGAMVSIMIVITTNITREFCPEIDVVVPPLDFVIILPLGGSSYPVSNGP